MRSKQQEIKNLKLNTSGSLEVPGGFEPTFANLGYSIRYLFAKRLSNRIRNLFMLKVVLFQLQNQEEIAEDLRSY